MKKATSYFIVMALALLSLNVFAANDQAILRVQNNSDTNVYMNIMWNPDDAVHGYITHRIGGAVAAKQAKIFHIKPIDYDKVTGYVSVYVVGHPQYGEGQYLDHGRVNFYIDHSAGMAGGLKITSANLGRPGEYDLAPSQFNVRSTAIPEGIEIIIAKK